MQIYCETTEKRSILSAMPRISFAVIVGDLDDLLLMVGTHGL